MVGGDSAVTTYRPLTPAQVLKWLPRDATPAQQDSVIQAHFKPCEIHWSERPDTLHLPGHDRGHNMLDVDIPQYYREGFSSIRNCVVDGMESPETLFLILFMLIIW